MHFTSQLRIILLSIVWLALVRSGMLAAAPAAVGIWTGGGPPSAFITSLVADPKTAGTLYAVTYDGGLYKSIDGARHWQASSSGLPAISGFLSIDPVTPTTLYASMGRHGIYKTVNGGASWAPIGGAGLPIKDIPYFDPGVVIDGGSPATLFAVVSDDAANISSRPYRSTDGGATWEPAPGGLPVSIVAMVSAPGNPGVLYAVAPTNDGFQTYKTVNSGATWALTGTLIAHIGSVTLAIDPQDPNTLYFGGRLAPLTYCCADITMARSTNGGASWESLNFPEGAGVIAIDPHNSAILYASAVGPFSSLPQDGVYKSVDRGATWARIKPLTQAIQIALDPLEPTIVYLGADGVYRSANGGQSWDSNPAAGLPSNVIVRLLSSGQPPVLYVRTNTPPSWYLSADGGASWCRSASTLESDVNYLAADPQQNGVIYADAQDGAGRKLVKSLDGGHTWARITTGLPAGVFYVGLTIDPRALATLYLSTNAGVYKSTNSGASWQPSGTGLPNDASPRILIDPANSRTLYAQNGIIYNSSIYKSTDTGASWHAASSGLPGSTQMGSLVQSPSNPSVLYVLARQQTAWQLYQSTNAATGWKLVNAAIDANAADINGSDVAIAVDPSNPSILYLSQRVVSQSTDGGRTWHSFGTGLPASTQSSVLQISAIAVWRAGTTKLAVATNKGVYILDTAGAMVADAAPAAPILAGFRVLLPLVQAPGGCAG